MFTSREMAVLTASTFGTRSRRMTSSFQSTLLPAMVKVAAAKGLDPTKMGEPEVKITEVHRLVR